MLRALRRGKPIHGLRLTTLTIPCALRRHRCVTHLGKLTDEEIVCDAIVNILVPVHEL